MATPIPTNHAEFNLGEISGLCSALNHGIQSERTVRGVVTDSRAVTPGCLFVALRGEHFDGHTFVAAAAQAGAAAVLIQDPAPAGLPIPAIRVASTLDALGRLAKAHRNRWGGRVVAVAGSAGKTTTRAAISALLSACYPKQVHFSPGNLNNRIGVPMVLLAAEEQHRFAVVEIGTNRTGEVGLLTEIAEPEVGVLTLIGLEHAEGLGSLASIEVEEGDLLAGLPPLSAAVVNGDDSRVLRQLGRSSATERIRYGFGEACDYRIAHFKQLGVDGCQFEIDARGTRRRVQTSLLGQPGALASTAAIAVAEYLANDALDADLVNAALRQDLGAAGRLQPRQLDDGTLLLDDTYNSNPVSVLASLAVAQDLARARRARLGLVLGDMLELGPVSEQEHRAIGHKLADYDPAFVIAVGEASRALAEESIPPTIAVADAAEAAQCLLEQRVAGDVLLIKGSRGVHLERVVGALAEAVRGGA